MLFLQLLMKGCLFLIQQEAVGGLKSNCVIAPLSKDYLPPFDAFFLRQDISCQVKASEKDKILAALLVSIIIAVDNC